jgi:hypothetical protein
VYCKRRAPDGSRLLRRSLAAQLDRFQVPQHGKPHRFELATRTRHHLVVRLVPVAELLTPASAAQFAGGIMDAKIAGEDAMRALYLANGVAVKGVGYTVVRPGGLTTKEGLGVSAVELNQGDDKSGRIARADVAAICVECLASRAAFDTTFECYYADTAKGLDDVMQSNAKGSTDITGTTSSGRERRADSWPKLFEGLRRDQVYS